MKFYIKRWKEILIYKLTFKKYYLCDKCKHIHKRQSNDVDINSKYGLYVSNVCAENSIIKARELLKNAILNK